MPAEPLPLIRMSVFVGGVVVGIFWVCFWLFFSGAGKGGVVYGWPGPIGVFFSTTFKCKMGLVF